MPHQKRVRLVALMLTTCIVHLYGSVTPSPAAGNSLHVTAQIPCPGERRFSRTRPPLYASQWE